MGANAGKVALVTNTTLLTCGASNNCSTVASVKDFVGYGSTATAFEGGGPTGTLANGTAAIRAGAGCTDTDVNSADFTVGTPTPRNSATPATVCGNSAPAINAPANPITTVQQDAAPFAVSLSGSDDGGVFQWGATAGNGIAAVSVTGGQGTASATYTVTLQSGFSGTATFTATLSDTVNAPASRTVNIAVTPLVSNSPPAIAAFQNPYTTVAQDAAPFTVSLSGTDDNNVFNWSATPGSGVSAVSVTNGQGTANVTYTVTPQTGFSGTATFTAVLSDGVNPNVSRAVNITVTPLPASHITISQIYAGGGNGGATYRNDYIELYNPTAQTVDLTGWSVQYGPPTQSNWLTQTLSGPIASGEYYLVKLSGGANGVDLPVTPNVDTTAFNMGAAAGKVALVSNSAALSGACPSVTTNLVDLVGYGPASGTTANCWEGTARATASPNTASAMFRLAGGATDTNQNGSDFVAAAASPRRTAIILDGAPTVTSADTDSELGETAETPIDATILLSFSEPVAVSGTWYDLTCDQTGQHDTLFAAGPRTWAITTKSNFNRGEKCTFKVFASQVRDEDTDDLQPNTDFMQADFQRTYTVVTGALAPEDADVHLALGNPSGAQTDAFDSADNYLMSKRDFALSYNRSRGSANWVSWHLTDEWKGPADRIDTFRPDPTLPEDWYHVQYLDYIGTGFDRGHLTPSEDRDLSLPVNQATFLMTNIIPQAGGNNQGPWARMESHLRTFLPANELYIVAGGWGQGGYNSADAGAQPVTTIAGGKVTVPELTWKVALVLPKDGGDDATRATCGARTLAVIMPNAEGIRNTDWRNYVVTVDQVEALTGYDFFSNLPDAVEACVEAGKDGNNPPGTADQSVMAEEDTAKAITLEAVSPDGGTLTYVIDEQPTHGTLSGSGANVTYTPAPEYKGGDSFKFHVEQGSVKSNVSTVTITVTEVNDAPVANADGGKTTAEDAALTFPAGDLTANDDAGAADESGQSLTVTEVTGDPAAAHGTVSLAGGQVTYVPDPNYNGPASFSYKVCDDGTTSGSPDSKCATATVSVSVTPVNDAPAAGADLVTTNEDTPVTFDVLGNDSDVDTGDTLSVSIATQPQHGVASVNPDGTVTYTPAPNANGPDSFNYTVSDGHGGSASAAVNVTVNPVNDAPVLGAIGDLPVKLGDTLSFTAVGSDIDSEAPSLTYSLTGAPENASFNTATGAFSWTPTAAQAGHVYTFTVRVTDEGGLWDEETFKVAVTYDWSGVLQPVNPDGSSVFKLGRTVPVKFQLTGASAGVTDAVARLHVAKVTNGVVGTEEEEADSTSSATEGNLFRYSDGQYIFNLSTAGLSAGTYQLRVDTGDGVLRVIQISLR